MDTDETVAVNAALAMNYARQVERVADGLEQAAHDVRRLGTSRGVPGERPEHVVAAVRVLSEVKAHLASLPLDVLVETAATADSSWRDPTPDPGGKPLGLVPMRAPFRLSPGAQRVYMLDAWYGTDDDRVMQVSLAERVGPDSWRQVGFRRYSSDTVVFPVQEG